MGNSRAEYMERDQERQDGVRYMQGSRGYNDRSGNGNVYGENPRNRNPRPVQGGNVRNGSPRNGEIRPVQGGRAQGGVPVNNRGSRVRSQKEQHLQQQQQQVQQQLIMLKNRMKKLSFFMGILLVVNMVVILGMYIRMQRMNETLKLIQSHVSVRESGVGADGDSTSSGERTGQGAFSAAAGGQAASGSGISVTGQDYVNLCGLEYVDRPRERTMEQVLDRLEQLAEDDARIADILENRYIYPDKLLEALANNPEMTDFVMGYEENAGRVDGTLTQDEKERDFPLFLQWDPRWGYGDYGDGSNIGLAGCGPTCLSMALFYLTGDESLTPDRMAEYSMKNGYYISGTGTAWALLQDVPETYGISVSQPKAEESSMKAALDSGSVIICSMGPGDFTAAGHFIVIYGYDKTGFLVNDPNCVARSRQSWDFQELKGQIKNIWVMGGSTKDGGVTSVADYIDYGKGYDG